MARRRPAGRGRGADATGRSLGGERFVALPHYLLKCAAWRSLTPNARALFVEVMQRYHPDNNGEIGLGVREAGAALGIRPQTAGVAFRLLLDRGFLHVGRDSAFSFKRREARAWHLTLFPVGDRPATKDFMRWCALIEGVTQMRKRPPTDAKEATRRNSITSDGTESSHRKRAARRSTVA